MIFWQCPKCGNTAKLPKPTTVTCKCGHVADVDIPSADIPPSIGQRSVNYVRAWWRWNAAGRPRRTSEEQAAIRALCTKCPQGYYKDKVCTHRRCGCSVAEPGMFGDKVAWATEHCPINEW